MVAHAAVQAHRHHRRRRLQVPVRGVDVAGAGVAGAVSGEGLAPSAAGPPVFSLPVKDRAAHTCHPERGSTTTESKGLLSEGSASLREAPFAPGFGRGHGPGRCPGRCPGYGYGHGLLGRLRRPSVAPTARAAASFWRGEPSRIVPPRGLPGMTLCGAQRAAGRLVPAQCQARHAPVSVLFRVLSSSGSRVEEAPGDGSDVVKELDGDLGSRRVD